MVDFAFNDFLLALGKYTDLGNGWFRERTGYGTRDSFIDSVYNTSFSIQYDHKMQPILFGQKIKLSEASEERELSLVDGNFVYRVTQIKGTLIPSVKSINVSDFRNPRKRIKYKRPSFQYREAEFTISNSNDPQASERPINTKDVSYIREHRSLIDKSFAICFMRALYFHPDSHVERVFNENINGRLNNFEMSFFKEVKSEYFNRYMSLANSN